LELRVLLYAAVTVVVTYIEYAGEKIDSSKKNIVIVLNAMTDPIMTDLIKYIFDITNPEAGPIITELMASGNISCAVSTALFPYPNGSGFLDRMGMT
jgi:hypothetical protein